MEIFKHNGDNNITTQQKYHYTKSFLPIPFLPPSKESMSNSLTPSTMTADNPTTIHTFPVHGGISVLSLVDPRIRLDGIYGMSLLQNYKERGRLFITIFHFLGG